MNKLLPLSIILIIIMGCKEKHDLGYRKCDMGAMNVIYDTFASQTTDECFLDFVFSKEDGEKSQINSITITGKKQYFAIDSVELHSAKILLQDFLSKGDSLLPLSKYYRQYIGFTGNGKKYIYVNLFSHYQCHGEYMPNIWHDIYYENSGKYDFGHVIVDLTSEKIIESNFLNSSVTNKHTNTDDAVKSNSNNTVK